MEREIQIIAGLGFLIIGVSHLVQPMAWVEYFRHLRSLGKPGMFADGFVLLNFGVLVVAFHNVWTWPAVVLTVVGWAQVAKAVLRFVTPSFSLLVYEKVAPKTAGKFRAAGVLSIALGAFFIWLAV